MISWIKTKASLVTSLILWDHHYEPYQVIIFRVEKGNMLHLIYYFQLDTSVVASIQDIQEFRTNTEEEKMFQIARIGLLILENTLSQKPTEEPSQQAPVLDQLFNEAFMSSLAIELMREKAPDYGFYSFSPNLKKLQKMIEGKPYHLLSQVESYIKKNSKKE
jgi:hypothetical protein